LKVKRIKPKFFLKPSIQGNFSDAEKKPKSFFKKFKNGFTYLARGTGKVSSGTIGVLEKVRIN